MEGMDVHMLYFSMKSGLINMGGLHWSTRVGGESESGLTPVAVPVGFQVPCCLRSTPRDLSFV